MWVSLLAKFKHLSRDPINFPKIRAQENHVATFALPILRTIFFARFDLYLYRRDQDIKKKKNSRKDGIKGWRNHRERERGGGVNAVTPGGIYTESGVSPKRSNRPYLSSEERALREKLWCFSVFFFFNPLTYISPRSLVAFSTLSRFPLVVTSTILLLERAKGAWHHLYNTYTPTGDTLYAYPELALNCRFLFLWFST